MTTNGTGRPVRAAIWERVSTAEQETANQTPDIDRLAAHRGYVIAERYELHQSAWSDNAAYRAKLAEVLAAAHRGEFDVLIVWALDRLSRQGAEPLLRIVRKLKEANVILVSCQEDWLSGSAETQELMVSIFGWLAGQESRRRSERVKAALARRKAAGKPVGRQAGATDRRKRLRSGYVASWEGPEADARKAALADRNRARAKSAKPT